MCQKIEKAVTVTILAIALFGNWYVVPFVLSLGMLGLSILCDNVSLECSRMVFLAVV